MEHLGSVGVTLSIGGAEIVLEFEVVEVQRPLLSAELLLTGGARIQLQRPASTLRLPLKGADQLVSLERRRGIFGFTACVVSVQGAETQRKAAWHAEGGRARSEVARFPEVDVQAEDVDGVCEQDVLPA